MFNSANNCEPNRWAVLALLGVAQLMVVLDGTIVNTALPSAQAALHFSTDSRQWIITAYALAFGSLLLVGGKLGDLFGRRWTFITGLVGFSLASVLGGCAGSFALLVVARGLQGAFAALLAPSALGLLTVTFADTPDRSKAFGIFGAIAAGGASIGLLLGGLLTTTLSWRWCLYVNPLIASPAVVCALRLLVNHPDAERAHIDLPGTVLAAAGLFALVFGLSNAEIHAWSAPTTIVALGLSPLLLLAFVLLQRRVTNPLLPLHVACDRGRGGAYVSVVLAASAMFAVLLFLTFYMQRDLGFSPLKEGLAFLPMSATVAVTSVTVQTRILARTGAKPIFAAGMILGAIALTLLSRLTVNGAYAGQLLPGLIIFGLGMGCIIGTGFATATLGVKPNEAGVAAAMVNTSQQIGGSVGTALLSTLFAGAAASYAANHPGLAASSTAALTHGYATAFAWGAGIFVLGLVLVLLILPARAQLKPRLSWRAAFGAASRASAAGPRTTD
jgi:EmrB/QacA subfamily drug resistance transporter